jgi:hypothetical protein
MYFKLMYVWSGDISPSGRIKYNCYFLTALCLSFCRCGAYVCTPVHVYLWMWHKRASGVFTNGSGLMGIIRGDYVDFVLLSRHGTFAYRSSVDRQWVHLRVISYPTDVLPTESRATRYRVGVVGNDGWSGFIWDKLPVFLWATTEITNINNNNQNLHINWYLGIYNTQTI